MPVLVGVAASQFIDSREKLERLIRVYYHTLVFIGLLVAAWLIGLIGEDLESAICVVIRPLALTAVVIAGLFIALSNSRPLPAFIGSSACLLLTVITGSRIATLAILALPIISPIYRDLPRKLAILGVIGAIGAGLLSTPIMQERFFRGESGDFGRIMEGQFYGAGRFETWPIVLEETLERPWLGHGEGSVAVLIPEIWENMAHPHNDYLRVAYELGGIGLLLLISVLGWQLWSLSRWIRRTDGVLQQAFAAAWLGLAAFMIIAFTDNPIVYNVNYMNPVFALMGAAYSVARQDEWRAEVPVRSRVYRPKLLVHRRGSRVLRTGGTDL
jgi:O-antigen ligase